MTFLNVAASIAAQIAAVIGARRVTRNRRNRAAQTVTVNGFNLTPDSWLIRASLGQHGPDAQYAALAELDCLAKHELNTKETS